MGDEYMKRGTFQWMKTVNKTLILNKIRTKAPISRSQIARETKLTPPTVSSNVRELIDEGLVIESELGESQGGRKPTMLLINHHGYYVIGVDVSPEQLKCGIANLSGKIIERSNASLEIPLSNQEFLNVLKKCIADLLEQIEADKVDRIIGIGVAMHGVVDVHAGKSLFAPNLSLKNIPIKEELEKEFDLEVKVENDARSIVLGEFLFGDHGSLDSMLVLNIGRGIGAGFMIHEELYHGAQDLAGEVGHMMIDLSGDICECGNRGCFQAMATGDAIVRRAQRDYAIELPKDASGETVYQRAKKGDVNSIEIFQDTGKIIGIALTNLIHIINPNKIILCGGVMNAHEFLMEPIRETIKHRVISDQAKNTMVKRTKHGDDVTLLGAVSLILVDLFNPKVYE